MSDVMVSASPKTLAEESFEQRARDIAYEEQQEQEQAVKERKSPFARFYQVNKDNSNYLRSCLRENPKALEMLFFLFDHMDKYNAVVCSYKVFQEALGFSTRSITRCIAYLKEHGFIAIAKSGTTNVYIANNDLVWNSWGNNMKYCEFPANVVLSSSEQEQQKEKVRDRRMQTVQLKSESKE